MPQLQRFSSAVQWLTWVISLVLHSKDSEVPCFSEPVTFRNLYHMFFASVGLSLGLFYFILFSCTLFWVSV